LEKDKEALSKKAHDIEQSKNEYENKMIQEKLKHHHTQGDLQKVKENLEEAQKSLNEEIEGRKQEIVKSEELKKRINDYDKKLKDHKRTIKKLSQKILEIQETSDSKREDTLTRESQGKEDFDDDVKVDNSKLS
jgi:chromosome segregation ATPase